MWDQLVAFVGNFELGGIPRLQVSFLLSPCGRAADPVADMESIAKLALLVFDFCSLFMNFVPCGEASQAHF